MTHGLDEVRATSFDDGTGMTRIYLAPGVVVLAPGRTTGAGGGPADELEGAVVPGVADALSHLADGTHEVVLLADAPPRGLEPLDVDMHCEPALPGRAEPGSWLITDDPEACQHVPHGIRTILVGPKRAPTHRPTPRCDLEARDLNAAVIEILASEAMA